MYKCKELYHPHHVNHINLTKTSLRKDSILSGSHHKAKENAPLLPLPKKQEFVAFALRQKIVLKSKPPSKISVNKQKILQKRNMMLKMMISFAMHAELSMLKKHKMLTIHLRKIGRRKDPSVMWKNV